MLNNLLDKIYCWLFSKEFFEYNIPVESLPFTYYECLHGDINFTLEERIEICKAVQEWNVFCDGYIRLDIVFDYTPANANLPPNRTAIIKASEEHPLIKVMEKSVNSRVLGLYCYDYKRGPNVYLCYEKLKTNSLLWRLVTLHELGHYLGLNHVENADRQSIMQPHCHQLPTTLTRLDAVEFARAYGVNPDNLVYRL